MKYANDVEPLRNFHENTILHLLGDHRNDPNHDQTPAVHPIIHLHDAMNTLDKDITTELDLKTLKVYFTDLLEYFNDAL